MSPERALLTVATVTGILWKARVICSMFGLAIHLPSPATYFSSIQFLHVLLSSRLRTRPTFGLLGPAFLYAKRMLSICSCSSTRKYSPNGCR